MPRMIDKQCSACGFQAEVFEEMSFFEDPDATAPPRPKCSTAAFHTMPARVNIPPERQPPPISKTAPTLAPGPMPHEVRETLADVLFDPCSCGQHAPAQLDEHEPECHVNNHSFMKPSSDSSQIQ